MTKKSSQSKQSKAQESTAMKGLQKYRDDIQIKKEKNRLMGVRLAKHAQRARDLGKKNKKHQTKAQKAGLLLPVHRFLRELQTNCAHYRIRKDAAVMMTGAIEYLCAEVLDLAGNTARGMNKKRISPRHIALCINDDAELHKLLNNVTISKGGVTPFIHPNLLKLKKSVTIVPPTKGDENMPMQIEE